MDREIGPQDNLTALTAGHRATARRKRLKGKNNISVTFDAAARVYVGAIDAWPAVPCCC